MSYFFKCFKQYFDFSGRARRKEYWFFYLYSTLLFSLLAGLTSIKEEFGIVSLIYLVGAFIPTLAVTVRRLHDVGKSGWMIFINLIPLIGPIWFFVLLVTGSESSDNKYGANPKE